MVGHLLKHRRNDRREGECGGRNASAGLVYRDDGIAGKTTNIIGV